MGATNILLEAGTNELEIVEFYLDEFVKPDDPAIKALEAVHAGNNDGGRYRGYYGVNVAKVLEIIRMPKITELPEVQDNSVMGAFNLRSRIIPLVDLGLWLGKKHSESIEEPKTIVTEFNNVTTAFMVSGVNRIHRISWEQVEQPNQYMASVSSNTIVGVIQLENRIIFLLDLEKIVASLNPGLGLRLENLGEDWDHTAGYKALIADDSALIREMQKKLLERAGFTVTVTTNGREAWDYLQNCRKKSEEEHKPISEYVQVVVSDIEMPIMDGLNLTHRIKHDEVLKCLPVILFSSLITDKLKHKGESVGADDQITKPQVGTLAKRSAALIRKRGLDRGGVLTTQS